MAENVVSFDFDSRDGGAGDLVDASLSLRKGASLRDGALRLDGRNDYALVAPDAGLAVESGEIAFTFNADTVHGARTILSRDSGGFDGGGHLTIWIDDGKLKVRLQSDSESFVLETDAHAIRAHRDYDVVFGFGEGGMSLSVDGRVVDVNAYTGGLAGNNEPLTLGVSQMYSSDGKANHLRDYFDGEIKGFRMTQNTSNDDATVVIAHEDFENGASGWSNGRTGHSSKLGDYLGGFDGHETTSKCFDVPAGVEKLTITFDFLELDSWDHESFFVFVDGVKVDLGAFTVNRDEGARSGVSNGIEWSTVSQGAPKELGGSNWHNQWSHDQVHKVTLSVPASLISGDKLTLKFDSTTDQNRHDESFGIDNLKIVGHLADGDDCAVTETLLHEDFDGLHRPEDSADVVGHTNWEVKNGALFTNGHEDGAIAFRPIELKGHVAGAFSFDIKADAVEKFEESGQYADSLTVQLRVDGGHWITIDTLRRDGHSDEFVGDQSGFRFGDDGFTTLTYLNENLPGGSETVQFRLVSHITAGDEVLRIDNVKITADKDVCDACEGLKIDFNDLAKGTIVSGQFEHVTISAKAFGPGKTYHLEAEHMHRDGFHKTHGAQASGGDLVFASGDASEAHPATLSSHFAGHTATYDVTLFIQDETDGQSEVTVTIGGDTRTIVLDRDTDGGGGDNSGFTKFVLQDVSIANGDRIEISSFRDGGERVRIDKLSFEEVRSGENRAMIFDTDHITGGDHDLRNGDGKVLIVSEDGDSSDPDDNAAGGEITFDFDPGVTVDVTSIVVVDTEEGGKVEAFGADGASLGVVDLPRIADGAVATVDLGFEGVAKLVVTLNGSGAIDDLCYEKVDAPLPGSLSGRYFCDTNDNDIDDGQAIDPGEAGVLVTLLDANGDPVLDADSQPVTTVTGAQGEYRFVDLPAGIYGVRFTDPDGVLAGKRLVTPNVGGDDAVDSDAIGDIALSEIEGIVVVAGQDTPDNDAGAELILGSLSGKYFADVNRDGLDNDGPNGIGGIVVELLDENGDPTGITAITGDDGSYSFGDLVPGTYGVKFTDPDTGRELTTQNVDNNASDAIDSDAADVGGGMSTITGITVVGGQDTPDNDAGVVTRLASLGDRVFFDDNRNGVQDTGEAGVQGVTVTLTGGGADGMIGTADDTTATDVTDANGEYGFDGLNPGEEYKVTFSDLPDGFGFTEADQGGDDAADSDADPTNGMTPIVTLAPGENNPTLDAGIVQLLGSIAGRFFHDDNRNGIDDNESETPIVDAWVDLFRREPDGSTVKVGREITDADGRYLFEDLPAGDYFVRFQNQTPNGKEFVEPNVGDDDTVDSDSEVFNVGGAGNGNTLVFPLAPGENITDVDAGVQTILGSLSGKYFADVNRDGLDNDGANGIGGILVELLDQNGDPTGITAITGDDGSYSFGDLVPGTYGVKFTDPGTGRELTTQNVDGDVSDAIDSDAGDVGGGMSTITGITVVGGQDTPDNDAGVVTRLAALGDRVFFDDDRDGVQDAGEAGVQGVTVTLTGGGADGIIGTGDDTTTTTTTDADGLYHFDGLNPGEEYQVAFSDLPDGFDLTAANQGGDDALDSDANPTTGATQIVTLAPGEKNTMLDAGVVQKLAGLGDFVFFDDDGDGVQDAGEAGVDGVTVKLLDADGNPVLDGNNQPITTVTANGGAYSFTGLVPGTYSVMFIAPAGLAFTGQDQGGDDALDSDANPLNGMTQRVTLAAGEFNGTLDAGLIVPNGDPMPMNDMAKTCADETVTVDVLDNDADPENDPLTITQVDGQAIAEGQTITTSAGTLVTLIGGELVVDGEAAYAALDIGQEATEVIAYTVSDGNGATATASLTMTFCGDANSAESLDAALKAANTEVTFIVEEVASLSAFTEAYTLNLLSSTNDDIALTVYTEAYCLDSGQDISLGVLTTADVSILTEDNLAAVAPLVDASKFDSVNWLLNNDFTEIDNGDGTGDTYTDLEVQEAIWLLLNGETFFINNPTFTNPQFRDNGNGVRDGVELATEENAMEIAMAAMTQGDGFVAGDGDIIGLILEPTDPSQQDQPFVIGVRFDDIDCLC